MFSESAKINLLNLRIEGNRIVALREIIDGKSGQRPFNAHDRLQFGLKLFPIHVIETPLLSRGFESLLQSGQIEAGKQ